ncbi:MAG: DNA mismatch repair protein MutS [Alphaproteobacteria bacterium]
MMAQYFEAKRVHPDCLLFFRMGDFYELFFDDAKAAAGALDIALTHRGRHAGEDVPMCGVPVHAVDGYLARLIRKGFRVAVCEQVEDAAEARRRGGKALVRRDIVRVVTPGTLTEDTLLDSRQHNFLAAVAEAHGRLAMAWLDMSTGDFQVETISVPSLASALARLAPGELLVSDRLVERDDLREGFGEWASILTRLPNSRFDSENARLRLERLFGVRSLDAFGQFDRAELSAAGVLIDYVELTQKGRLPRFSPPRRMPSGAVMEIDAATRRNLELVHTLNGERSGSLLSVIDRTVTGGGARLLATQLAAPLTDAGAIRHRLDSVQYFADAAPTRDSVRETLRRAPDLERALSRLTVGRGGPRDLAAIRDALGASVRIREMLAEARFPAPPPAVEATVASLADETALIERLRQALAGDVPILVRDGGFIAPGCDSLLDEQRALRDGSRRLIAELQSRYASEAGVANLKIRHNNVLGYYIEVSATHAPKLQGQTPSPFIHRQTMAGAMRFTTVELGGLEDKINRAADRALARELELFEELSSEVKTRAERIGQTARAMATLDVAAGLADLAVERRYCRPIVDDSLIFRIEGGRHPVVEAVLAQRGDEPFIANDCDLSDGAGASRLWLVTGPNMAGKSTFLRQNALIAILAQMGSYVPAQAAHVGVVDRLFSRVGAADDLARGRSTFMVEMVETATILNQAGRRSLVILDEIGRGTATFDGLSIAWASLEHLHSVNESRALFATHYHELTALASRLERMACHTMRVKEWQDNVVFLHEVAPGVADRSYGIHVGRLAGLPESVVARAEEVLAALGRGEQAEALGRLADDLPLFRVAKGPIPRPADDSPLEQAIAALNPDELTPRRALEMMYEFKALLRAAATATDGRERE